MFRVLIVDDDQVKACSVATVLREDCACDVNEITHVSDVLHAKRVLSSEFFQLLVLDVALPMRVDEQVRFEGGLELLKEICERSGYRMPAYLVGLSGNKEALDRVRAEFSKRVVGLIEYSPISDAWKAELVACVRRLKAAELTSQQTEITYGLDCAVVCALEQPELDAVRRLEWTWTEDPDEGASTRYWRTQVATSRGDSRSVVAAVAPRMGMVASAIMASNLIHKYRPRYLAMVGITAGAAGKTQLGDVIVADPAWDYGCGKWIRKGKTIKFEPAPHQLPLDPRLRKRMAELAEDSAWLARIREEWPGDKPPTVLNIKIGPAASGAAVLADGATLARVKEQHRGVLGIEMEAYSIYAVSASAPQPRPIAISMKSVVDFANPAKADEVQRYAAFVSARVLKRFIMDVV